MRTTLLLILVSLVTSTLCRTQRATEVFIPIGRSPGVSGKVSTTGTCLTVDQRGSVVSLLAGDRRCTAKVTAETRIYLDRSRLGQPNTYGTRDDLREGRLVEIKYRDGQAADGGTCEWIKILIT